MTALTLSAAPAAAQIPESPVNITAFAGVAMAQGAHPAIGVAVGLTRRQTPVSLEFELSRSRSDPAAGVPAIGIFSGNVQIAVAPDRSRYKAYGTFGVGMYRLLRDTQGSEPDSAWNIGAGAKVALVGPLELRMDYRAFFLAPIPREFHSNVHRFYGAITAGF